MPFSRAGMVEWKLIALSILVTAGGWWAVRSHGAATREVGRTIAVRREFFLFSRAVIDTQRGQRGYLLTGKEADHLTPYHNGRVESADRLARLKEMTADSPYQAERLHAVETNLTDLFDELAWTVNQVRTGMKPDAFRMVDTGRGERALKAMRVAIDQCIEEEDRRLIEWSDRAGWLKPAALLSTGLTGLLFGILAVSFYARFRRRTPRTVYSGPLRRSTDR